MVKNVVVLLLPDDLIVEILARLPVKSLKRFSCVCKSWYDIIKDPVFIAKHLDQTRFYDYESKNFLISDFLAFSFLMLSSSGTSTETPPNNNNGTVWTRIHITGFEDFPLVYGICDGIVCLHSYSDGVALWNPATRETKSIPRTTMRNWRYKRDTIMYFAFGYDPKTGDYKIVKFVTSPIQEVELYTLSRDSWRQIDLDNVTIDIELSSRSYTSLKGRNHWLAYDEQKNSDLEILYFDMSDEVFGVIPLPDSFRELTGRITVYNEMIVLILYQNKLASTIEDPIDVWVMKEYGVKESCTLLSTTVGVHMALVVWSHDGVFMESSRGELLSYHPTSQQFKNLGVISDGTQPVLYQETLVSLNGMHEEEEAGILSP